MSGKPWESAEDLSGATVGARHHVAVMLTEPELEMLERIRMGLQQTSRKVVTRGATCRHCLSQVHILMFGEGPPQPVPASTYPPPPEPALTPLERHIEDKKAENNEKVAKRRQKKARNNEA